MQGLWEPNLPGILHFIDLSAVTMRIVCFASNKGGLNLCQETLEVCQPASVTLSLTQGSCQEG